jgi:hypothetical protein
MKTDACVGTYAVLMIERVVSLFAVSYLFV